MLLIIKHLKVLLHISWIAITLLIEELEWDGNIS